MQPGHRGIPNFKDNDTVTEIFILTRMLTWFFTLVEIEGKTEETLTKSSVESSVKEIMNYASRPLADFNKYEALEMLESLQHTAQDTKHERQNFYRLVYQTVRRKMDVPHDQLKSLILRLLSDKDHEKVFDVVAKVGKHYRRNSRRVSTLNPYDRGHRLRGSRGSVDNRSVGCFYCGKIGHFKINCNQRKRDLCDLEEKNRAPQPPTK